MTFRVGFVTGATPDKWARIWGERSKERLELVPVEQDVQLDGVRDGSLSMALVRLPVDREGLHLIPLYDEQPVVVLDLDDTLTLLDEVDQRGPRRRAREVVPMSLARLRARRDATGPTGR